MADRTTTISGKQHDLIQRAILRSLSVADDIYGAAMQKNYGEANELAIRTCQELTFLLADLEWEEKQDSDAIELITPPSIVRQVVSRILDKVKSEEFEGTEEEIRQLQEDSRELQSACEAVLTALPSEGQKT
jgi:GTP-binding protein EngB required for normal cell division